MSSAIHVAGFDFDAHLSSFFFYGYCFLCLKKNFAYPQVAKRMSILFTFFFFNGHTCDSWPFLDQGLNLSHSCDLHCSCGDTHCTRPGIEPESLDT